MLGRRGFLLGILAAPVAAEIAAIAPPASIETPSVAGIATPGEQLCGLTDGGFLVPRDLARHLQLGLMTINQARAELGLPGVEAGDEIAA